MAQRVAEGIAGLLSRIIEKWGFKVSHVYSEPDAIIINFYDPRLGDDLYFRSTIVYYRDTGRIEARVRVLLDRYRELYMEYCIEHCEMMCRPHFYIEDGLPILSMEAKFTEEPLTKLERLLEEMSP